MNDTADHYLAGYPRKSVLIWRLAHAGPPVYLIVALAQIAGHLIYGADGPPGVITWPLTLAVVFVAVGHALHHAILCGICMAKSPLDGAAEAERRDGRLRSYHSVRLSVVLVAICFLVPISHLLFDYPPLVMALLMDSTMLLGAVMFHVNLVHRLLSLWCPYCPRHGGGDDDEVVPVPVPPSSHASV